MVTSKSIRTFQFFLLNHRSHGLTQDFAAAGTLPIRSQLVSGEAGASTSIACARHCCAKCCKHSGSNRRNFRRSRIDRLVLGSLQHPVEKSSIKFGGQKIRVAQNASKQRKVRLDSAHKVFAEGSPKARNGL